MFISQSDQILVQNVIHRNKNIGKLCKESHSRERNVLKISPIKM